MARCWKSEFVTFSDIVRALLQHCSAQATVAQASTSLLAVGSEHCPRPLQSPRQPSRPCETAECVCEFALEACKSRPPSLRCAFQFPSCCHGPLRRFSQIRSCCLAMAFETFTERLFGHHPSSATFFAMSCSKFKTRHIRLTAFSTRTASLPLIVKPTTLDAETPVATMFQQVSAHNYVSDNSEIEQKMAKRKSVLQEHTKTNRAHAT